MATVKPETNQAAAAIYLGYWALPSYVLATQPGPLPVGSWRCFAGPVQHLRGGPLISNLTREPCIRNAHAAQDRRGPLPVGSWGCFAGPVQHLRGGPLISNLTREPCIRSAHAAQDRQNTVGPEKGRRRREKGGAPEGGRPLKRGALCVGGGRRRPSKGAARP